MARTQNIPQSRGSRLLLLCMDQRAIRVFFEKLTQYCLIRHYTLPKSFLGEYTVAVEVYRSSDGSFLETQDMFRLPGIFRTVSLTAKPEIQIRDLHVIPKLDEHYKGGTLQISAELRNLSSKTFQGYRMRYALYSLPLYRDTGAVEIAKVETTSTHIASILRTTVPFTPISKSSQAMVCRRTSPLHPFSRTPR